MRLLLTFTLGVSAWGAVTVHRPSIQATSKEIVFSYTAPDTSACTIQASRVNDFSGAYVPVDDVDTAKFAGSNLDSRAGAITNGFFRTFVLGSGTAAVGSDGYTYSRALKAATTHYIKVTCGVDTATFTASTKTVPFGVTRGESLPADPSNPGEYLHPSRKWDVSGQKVVDPETGVELSFPEAAGSRGATASTVTFKDAAGSSWTNPSNALADDASSATISGSSATLFLRWNQDTAALGTSGWSGYDGSGLDYLRVLLKGQSSAATAADRTVQVALTFDGGVTAGGPWNDAVLPTTEGTVTVGSTAPGQTLQTAGRPPIDKTRTTRRSGTLTYVASTKVATLATGSTSRDWSAGTKLKILGSAIDVSDVAAGNPPTVTTRTAHGFSTGNTVTISGVTGTIASSVNGTWTITVTGASTFTLNGVNAAGAYGTAVQVCQREGGQPTGIIKTAPGSPPVVYAPNSFFSPNPFYAKLSGFTSTGWTSLNGNVYQMAWNNGTDSEAFTVTGATTTGTYDQTAGDSPNCYTPLTGAPATITKLTGAVQGFTEYPIASIDSGTQVTLTSGPASDIASATPWQVDGFGVLIRKKTTSADAVNVNYVSANYQTSTGTGWRAAGGPIFSESVTTGPGGKPGSLGYLGNTNVFISADGTVTSAYGRVMPHEELTLPGQGSICVGDSYGFNVGYQGINPNVPNRFYCFPLAANNDRMAIVGDYVGDYRAMDPAKGANSYYTNYAGYPVVPNCNGYNGIEGTNPPVSLPGGTPCIKYRILANSLKALVQTYGGQKWQQMDTSFTNLNCRADTNSLGIIYNATSSKVEMSISCGSGQDHPALFYVFQIDDTANTIAPIGEVTTWDRDGARWSGKHGGATPTDHLYGHLAWFPHPINVNLSSYTDINLSDTGLLRGPFSFLYTALDGVSNADMTATIGSCASYAGNPYLPATPPNGSTLINGAATGCHTITISREPCDDTPSPTEQAIVSANSATHSAKCGSSGPRWLQDIKVGDMLLHYNPSANDWRYNEYFLVIAKTGSGPGATLGLYRGGGVKPMRNDIGPGAQNHTGQGRRLIAWTQYSYDTGMYPLMYADYATYPTGTSGGKKNEYAPGHGQTTRTATVGASPSGGGYGVALGPMETRRFKVQDDFAVENQDKFAGRNTNNNLSLDTHATYIAGAGGAPANYFDYLIDGRPWNGYSGVNGTLVAGTVGVYKWAQATWSASTFTMLYPKHLPVIARSQRRVLRSISGPGSSITDAAPFTYCYALLANECRSGSSAGDFFMSVPDANQVAAEAQSSGADKSANYDLSFTSATANVSRYTQTLLRSDMTGGSTRVITSGFDQYRVEDSFKNWSMTNDGKTGVGRTRGLENVKSEVWTAEMPPIRLDSWDRTKYIMWPITVPAYPGANQAMIEFGYGRYGAPGSYYCMDRADACRAGGAATDADPFMFAAETLRPTTCTSGCTINVPLVGNRIVEWRVKYFNTGSPVYTGPRRVMATP